MFLFICCVCFIRFPFLQCWLNVAVVMMGAFIRAKNPQKWILLFLAWRNGARCFLVMILSAPAWQFVVSPLCFQKDTFFFDFFFALIVPDPSLRVIAERIAENLYLIGFPSLQDIYTVFYVLISFLVLPQVSHHGNKNRESCNEDQKSTNRAKQIKISNSG